MQLKAFKEDIKGNGYCCVMTGKKSVSVCTSVSVRRAAASWPDVAGLPSGGEEKSLPWSSAHSSGI